MIFVCFSGTHRRKLNSKQHHLNRKPIWTVNSYQCMAILNDLHDFITFNIIPNILFASWSSSISSIHFKGFSRAAQILCFDTTTTTTTKYLPTYSSIGMENPFVICLQYIFHTIHVSQSVCKLIIDSSMIRPNRS